MKFVAAFILLLAMPMLALAGESLMEKPTGSYTQNNATKTMRISQRASYQHYPTPDDTASYIYHYYYNANNVTQLDSLKSFRYGIPESTFYYTYTPSGKITDMKMGSSEFYGDRGLWYHADYDAQNRISLAYLASYNNSLSLTQIILSFHAVYDNDGLNTLLGHVISAENPYYTRSTFTLNAQGSPVTEYEQISSDSLYWEDNSLSEWTWEDGNTGDTSALIEDRASLEFLNWYSRPWIPGYRPSSMSKTTWGIGEVRNSTYTWNNEGNLLEQVNTVSGNLEDRFLYFYDANGYLLYKAWYGIYGLDHVFAYTWEQASTSDDPSMPIQPIISLSAYPQPFTGSLNLVVKSIDNSLANIDIYNVKGQRLQSYKAQPNTIIVWDGRDEHGKQCSSGIYLIKAKQNNHSITTRVIRIK